MYANKDTFPIKRFANKLCCFFDNMKSNIISLVVLFTFLTIFTSVGSKIIRYNWRVGYFYGAPDGVTRKILGVNGQYPGPTIRARLGDRVIVTVHNNIGRGEGLSIHWHGLEQVGTPAQDGLQGVTQCGIEFGHKMVYTLDMVQSGTYWWHSHHSTQYTDGCWGAMIVENRREVYHYDNDLTFSLNEWFHTPSHDLLHWYLSPANSRGLEPIPDSVMINGKGNYPCKYAPAQGRHCREPSPKYGVYEAEQGAIYRIRIINTGSMTNFNFSIDGHQLETIETDGVDTVKVKKVDVVRIFSGQRYSFLVRMNKGEVGKTFWIRSSAFTTPFNGSAPNYNKVPEAFLKHSEVKAILLYTPRKPNWANKNGNEKMGFNSFNISDEEREVNSQERGVQGRPAAHDTMFWRYAPSMKESDVGMLEVTDLSEDAGLEDQNKLSLNAIDVDGRRHKPKVTIPTTSPKGHGATMLNPDDCRPIGRELAYATYDQLVVLNIDFFLDRNGVMQSGFNRTSYKTGPDPVLSMIIRNKPVPPSLNPIRTKFKKIVQIVVNNPNSGGHPIHLHGHTFWVVGGGTGNYNDRRDRGSLRINGPRRDTTSVGPYRWIAIRYRADNPGPWLLHCHYNWHLHSGLGAIFVEGQTELRNYASHFLIPEFRRVCKLKY